MSLLDMQYKRMEKKDYAAARELLECDTDKEFLLNLIEEPESYTAVYIDDTLVALAFAEEPAPLSFLMVFVAPQFRRQGIGSAVAAHEENRLLEGKTQRIESCFHSGNEAALAFSRRLGYNRNFSSAYMERAGGLFPIEPLPVRGYTDADYLSVQPMYAKAFHEMRLRVGDFPDSVISQPNDKDRKSWMKDMESRYLYEEDGQIVAYSHICGNEIGSVSVHTDYQGRGIGRKFVKYLCNEIYQSGNAAVGLWCVVGNYARNLYDSLGFEQRYIGEFTRKILR